MKMENIYGTAFLIDIQDLLLKLKIVSGLLLYEGRRSELAV